MTDDNYSSTPPSGGFGGALRALLRWLLRLILVILAGGLLGVAVYLGLVILYQQAIEPARQNAIRIDDLEARQSESQRLVETRLANFSLRLAALESQGALSGETIAGLQSELRALGAQMPSIERLEEMGTLLRRLDAQVQWESTRVAALQGTLAAGDSPLAVLQREVRLLKAMQFLNRSRLYLAQNNYGLARQEVENARQVLLELAQDAPEYQQAALAGWLSRLDMALNNLPSLPVIAADDLEIAWWMMAAGLPGLGTPVPPEVIEEGATLTPTPTPPVEESTVTFTPTLTPSQQTVTPTPFVYDPASTPTPP